MTIYLNDFADHEDSYYSNQYSEIERDVGFSAEFGQWYDRCFSLQNSLALAISIDEYSDFVIERFDPNEEGLVFRFCLSGAIKIG